MLPVGLRNPETSFHLGILRKVFVFVEGSWGKSLPIWVPAIELLFPNSLIQKKVEKHTHQRAGSFPVCINPLGAAHQDPAAQPFCLNWSGIRPGLWCFQKVPGGSNAHPGLRIYWSCRNLQFIGEELEPWFLSTYSLPFKFVLASPGSLANT